MGTATPALRTPLSVRQVVTLWTMGLGLTGVGLVSVAVLYVSTANGQAGVPWILAQLVYTAYWPTAALGVPETSYFYPDFMRHVVLNLIGWTALGTLCGLIHAAIRILRGVGPS